MFGIKKQLIKNAIKLEVVQSIPGKLVIYVAQIKKLDEAYKKYFPYVEEGIKFLKGIESVMVDYEKGLVSIKYDTDEVSAQKIYHWLTALVNRGVDEYEDVKKQFSKADFEEDKLDQTVEKIWQQVVKPALLTEVQKIK